MHQNAENLQSQVEPHHLNLPVEHCLNERYCSNLDVNKK